MWEKIISHKILVLFSSLFIVTAVSGYLFQTYLFGTQKSTVEDKSADVEPENKTINFLILGVDERDGDIGRSDTILVLSTNLATKKIGLISIPRDSRVELVGHGETKINHAYAYGGVALTRQVVEKTLNIKIDNYIVFNFKTFKNAIDKINGVDIDVEKDMYYRDDYDGDNGLLIDLKAGKQHLDGEKSMEYVRFRDEEGDIGRVKRQQNFLNAVIKKITSPETLIKLPAVMRDVFTSVKTDITFDNLMSYISFLKPNQGYQIQSMMVDGSPKTIDDLSYWIIDFNKLKKDLIKLNNFMINKKEDELVASSDKTNDEENGIFKHNEDNTNPLDWELQKLVDNNKGKDKNQIDNIRNRLLAEEAEERQQVIANRNYQTYINDDNATVSNTQNNYNNPNGIKIINTTSDIDKTNVAISALEDNGIDIGTVNNKSAGKSSNDRTIFIVSSKDTKITSILRNLPFKFTIIYKNDTAKNTLIIGDDFYK